MRADIPRGSDIDPLLPSYSIQIRVDGGTERDMASASPSSSELNYSSAILVVGAGTWGASTALHLARRGYTNVTVLDAYPQPSAISAGNDVNKIVSFSEFALFLLPPRPHNRPVKLTEMESYQQNPLGKMMRIT